MGEVRLGIELHRAQQVGQEGAVEIGCQPLQDFLVESVLVVAALRAVGRLLRHRRPVCV